MKGLKINVAVKMHSSLRCWPILSICFAVFRRLAVGNGIIMSSVRLQRCAL